MHDGAFGVDSLTHQHSAGTSNLSLPLSAAPVSICISCACDDELSTVQAWLPESPRWLLLSGAPQEAAEGAVRRAWGSSASDSQAVQQEVSNMMRDNPTSSSGELPGP